MKIKLLKKLRKEAKWRYIIIVEHGAYRFYDKVEKKSYSANSYWLTDLNKALQAIEEIRYAYIVNKVQELKLIRELTRRGLYEKH